MNEDNKILDDHSLDLLFRDARSFSHWRDEPVSDVLLQAVYDLMKWAPTSANCSPMRLLFLHSPEAKERLKPYLKEGNVDQTMTAPVVVILANDRKFYEHLPMLFPHTDAKSWFEGDQPLIEETAMRNGTLQGAYFMMAARALGLDCGPMSGFDQDGVKGEFLPDEDIEVNFLCNLGHGNSKKLHSPLPRFEFDDVCKIL